MSEADLNALWETMELLAATLETPQAPREQLAVALHGCLQQVVQYPPEELVTRAERSVLPTKPLVSWLVYEAERLGNAPAALALRQYWQTTRQASAGPLLAPPSQDMI
jgi:homoserine kinase